MAVEEWRMEAEAQISELLGIHQQTEVWNEEMQEQTRLLEQI